MFSRHFLNIQLKTYFMTPLDLCFANDCDKYSFLHMS